MYKDTQASMSCVERRYVVNIHVQNEKRIQEEKFNEENNSIKMTNLLKPSPFTGFLSAEHPICDGNLTPEMKNNH